VDFVYEAAAPRVVFAAGALARVPAEVDRFGARRVFLLAGARAAGYADTLAGALGARLCGRTGEVAEHVPAAVAEAAVTAVRAAGADLLVALGGGSATGLAKAVALATGLPILAVPTTYAGSEMTSIWGRTEAGRKTTGRAAGVRPAVVVYDPVLTRPCRRGCPRPVA